MKRLYKIGLALALPLFGGYLALAILFNEALHIKRISPEAKVHASHRFSPVFSPWDLFGILVPWEYLSPIDHADVVIDLSSKPVSIRELVNLRVSSIRITDSEIIDFDYLLSNDENPYIILVGPTFLDASEDDLKKLNTRRRIEPSTGYLVYSFGNV